MCRCRCQAGSAQTHSPLSNWKRVTLRDRSELKGIPKPDKFNGASGPWDSWWYKFKTWVESCHKNAVKIVAQDRAQCDKEITESGLEVDFDDGAEPVSAQARQALISLTEGEALEIVKNTSRGSHFGLEVMRRLLCKYDPQNPQANSVVEEGSSVLANAGLTNFEKDSRVGRT